MSHALADRRALVSLGLILEDLRQTVAQQLDLPANVKGEAVDEGVEGDIQQHPVKYCAHMQKVGRQIRI